MERNILLKPPCNVGEKLFVITKDEGLTYIEETQCCEIGYRITLDKIEIDIYIEHQSEIWGKNVYLYHSDDFGQIVFYTKYEAEEKLKKIST